MTLLENLHQEHKARLARLGAIPVKPLRQDLRQQAINDRQTIIDLQKKIERQKDTISGLNTVVAKQRKTIREFSDQTESTTPRIADVVAVIAEHYGLTRLIIVGEPRTGSIAFARQVGYYICRELGYSWHSIGRGFCKDHSSALHGNRKVMERLQRDPALALEIEE